MTESMKTRPSVMVQPYSVQELTELRAAVTRRFHFGSYLPTTELFQIIGRQHMFGRTSQPGEAVATIEEETRTHMVAGHTAEMLIQEERRSRAEFEARSRSAA